MLRLRLALVVWAVALGALRCGAEISLAPAAASTGGSVIIVSPVDAAPLVRWLNARGLAAWTLPARATEADIARAIRELRSRAGEWKLSPTRIALLGFSGGADLAARIAYQSKSADADAARPNLVALIWPTTAGPAIASGSRLPPTFLVGATPAADNVSGLELWQKLRAARAPVDAHFFARAMRATVLASDDASVGAWPEMFFAWARFSGLLTDAPRVAVKGMAYLVGRPLPHGYVIFTPLDFVGTGPVVGRVLNSTAGVPIGEFTIPAEQGPVAGRYRVDVRQNMNRWLSNSFSGDLVNARGAPTPAQAYFGHHRQLEPSIDDQHSYVRVHPTDREEATIEFQPGAQDNLQLKIEVFSR